MMEAVQPRVLIVDDTPVNIEVLARILGDGYDVIVAMNGEDALALAETENPDIILLDVMMPGLDGFEVCERLKSAQETADIPVVFVTALSGSDDETRGLEAGAVDYIVKPFHPAVVRARVKNHIELKQLRDRFEKLSLQDGLTGIANRRHYDESLQREWRRAQRNGSPLSLLMIDIDHFKRYNDHYGHLAGDDCLREVAALLAVVAIRAGDLAARPGGEEFAIVLGETATDGALQVAERVRHGVEALAIRHEDSPVAGVVTVSVGVATVTPRPNQSADYLVQLADDALYEAKSAGRNRIVADKTESA